MIQGAFDAVKDFHAEKGLAPECKMPITNIFHENFSKDVILQMKAVSANLELLAQRDDDQRFLRAHLLLEELAETLEFMFRGEVVETLDGLCDLIYVAVGTAVQFQFPLDKAFREVHRSNMSKGQAKDVRLRDKGETYQPADIKKFLEGYV